MSSLDENDDDSNVSSEPHSLFWCVSLNSHRMLLDEAIFAKSIEKQLIFFSTYLK